jgi:hypothetical protein
VTAGLRVTVTAGSPTAEELAAVVVVVVASAAAGPPTPATRPAAWGRAARLEALGEAPLVAAVDPRLGPPGPTRR